MKFIIAILKNEIVVNWVAPIVCSIISTPFVKSWENRRSGRIPQSGRQGSSQGSIFRPVTKRKWPMIVGGVLVFLMARTVFNFVGEMVQQEGKPDPGIEAKEESEADESIVEKEEEPHWVDDDGTEYYGNRIDGKIEGEGKAVYKNGDVYEGEFKAGLRDGKGTLSSSGVVVYDGEWKDNVEEGSGINYFPESKGRYEGEFKAGKREGNGIYYWEGGSRYEGKWENGIRNGMGVFYGEDGTISPQIWLKDELAANLIWNAETWAEPDGTIYTGRKINGKIEGYGRSVDSNRSIYLGEFKDGKREGKGIFYFYNGDYYEGEWKDDSRNGVGIYFFKDGGNFYHGEYLNNRLEGTGTYYQSSGFRYEGGFKDGNYFGEGTAWYSPEDESGRWYFEGEWLEGSQNGTMYYRDGTCETGVFQDDVLIEETGEMKGIKNRSDVVAWTDEDGTQYIGRKENGVLEGEGIRIDKNDVTYIGEFVNGISNGTGTEYYKNGDYYVGEFADGKRNGMGVYYYSDEGNLKDWYAGEWKDGKRNGECIIEFNYSDSSFYIGEHVDSMCNGTGSMHYTSGVYYGEWQNNVKAGIGVFNDVDGSCYFGEYEDNRICGQGVMYYIDGSRYEGEWKEGKRNGIGTEYDADGNKKYGTWVEGVYQN